MQARKRRPSLRESWINAQGTAIQVGGLVQAALLLQKISEVEVCARIVRIGADAFAVFGYGIADLALVLVYQPEGSSTCLFSFSGRAEASFRIAAL